MTEQPLMIIIAGPNGAGKTTTASKYIPNQNIPFVNADEIAKGLDPFSTMDNIDIVAGKITLKQVEKHIANHDSFSIETTLAASSHKRMIQKAKESGYHIYLAFVYIDNVDLCKNRVMQRVSEGGHNIPENTILRRYEGGLKNLIGLYKPIVDEMLVLDNSKDDLQDETIYYSLDGRENIFDNQKWAEILKKGK